ncbi:MAG: phosphoethanolamine--lipid A transferase [Geothermobacteraceae bacterium]
MTLSREKAIVATALFITLTDNAEFFSRVAEVYPPTQGNLGFFLSTSLVLFSFLVFFFSLVCTRKTLKPVLILSLVIASVISYYSNEFGTIIDTTMIQNILETDRAEAFDLLTPRLFLYLSLLGFLPAWFLHRANIPVPALKRYALGTLKISALALLTIAICLFSYSKAYTSFFREHKPLRFYTNPTYAYYSAGLYIAQHFKTPTNGIKQIALDAKREETDSERRLVILVVGEAARADHFSLNGYSRTTNPLLSKENIVNLPELYSCGTTTAISVPCMFSPLDRDHYSDSSAKSSENVLDIFACTGVHVLWRDNNSGSKGVAARVPFENYRSAANNKVCDTECRDVGMLDGLQEYIDRINSGDILIVLHQMGNHGPAYSHRYPAGAEVFSPSCQTSQLEQCSVEEIINAYDNAIRYTDYFLAQTIKFLKQYDRRFETAMIYMSDHGESLGEGGIYLHGLPWFIAPDAQKHVAGLLWLGSRMQKHIHLDELRSKVTRKLSHDNLFHTLLGLMRINTHLYEPEKDLFHLAEKN